MLVSNICDLSKYDMFRYLIDQGYITSPNILDYLNPSCKHGILKMMLPPFLQIRNYAFFLIYK